MKAAFINQHGEPEVLQYGDLPDPVASRNPSRQTLTIGCRK
jgi:hypothetical protein